jgi:hypothetical protein
MGQIFKPRYPGVNLEARKATLQKHIERLEQGGGR